MRDIKEKSKKFSCQLVACWVMVDAPGVLTWKTPLGQRSQYFQMCGTNRQSAIWATHRTLYSMRPHKLNGVRHTIQPKL